jgi:hypothetical protein
MRNKHVFQFQILRYFGVVTGYGLHNGSLMIVRGRYFLRHHGQTSSEAHPYVSPMGTYKCEADHSLPSNAEVWMCGDSFPLYAFISFVILRHRGKCILTNNDLSLKDRMGLFFRYGSRYGKKTWSMCLSFWKPPRAHSHSAGIFLCWKGLQVVQ